MNVYDALISRRTVRKFKQENIEREQIIKMIDAARLSPCAGNIQSFKYTIIDSFEERKAIFPYIKYAGYISDWNPSFSDTPPAFIAVLNDTGIRKTGAAAECDCGILMMAVSLLALEMGFGSCILGAVDREKTAQILKLDPKYDIMYLIGIGKPNHENFQFNSDESIKYTMDTSGNFHVPKRNTESLIV